MFADRFPCLRMALYILIFGCMSVSLLAQENTRAVLCASITQTPPVIDGVIKEDEWKDAARVEGLGKNGVLLSARDCVFWVTADSANLYLAVRSVAPPGNHLLTRVKPRENADQINAYRDDNIELWLAPHLNKPAGDRRFFQIIINELGARYDVAYDPHNKQQEQDVGWDAKIRFASRVHDGWWHAEMAFPFAALGVRRDDLSRPWGLRVIRNFRRSREVAHWGPRGGKPFAEMTGIGMVVWTNNGILVRQTSTRKPENGSPDAVFEIHNRGKAVQAVRIRSRCQAADSAMHEQDMVAKIQPGSVKTVHLSASEVYGLCRMFISVASADGSDIYFQRKFNFRINKPDTLWSINQESRKAVLFDIAYYPYYGKFKARLDLSGLDDRRGVTGARVVINNKQSGKLVVDGVFPAFHDNESEVELALPDLPDGIYVATASLTGGGNLAKTKLSREFRRKHFEWEHNTLGITDEVIPPFTPLKVKEKVVECVLREHHANDFGIWDQVTSKGKNILAAPMRFEIRANGRKIVPQAVEPVKFTQPKNNEIHISAEWRAGTINVSMRNVFEMDGMMKVEMTVSGNGKTRVEAMDLVIPIRDGLASLMHVVVDRHLSGFAGRTPRGTGRIWDSCRSKCVNLAGTFVPYVWLGNEQQGMCWFADSDQGWLVDDKTPCLELYRENGAVLLKVRFVTRPAPIGKARTIVFGLQATPTKPMPVRPAHWRRWILSNAHKDLFNIRILGSGYYWGTWTPCNDVHPANRDFTLYDLIADARRTGKVDGRKWDAFLEKYGPDKKNIWRRHLGNTRRAVVSGADAMIPYTNARGCVFLEEFQTFQDEWLTFDYTPRNFKLTPKSGFSYEVSPGRSYQDYCLWYFRKMITSGAMDGLYFDCVFPKGNLDVVSGSAYHDSRGVLRPGGGYLRHAGISQARGGHVSSTGQTLAQYFAHDRYPGRALQYLGGHESFLGEQVWAC